MHDRDQRRDRSGFGGHSAACTCADCVHQRRARDGAKMVKCPTCNGDGAVVSTRPPDTSSTPGSRASNTMRCPTCMGHKTVTAESFRAWEARRQESARRDRERAERRAKGPRDYYEVLGVSRTSSTEEIRTKYRRLALEYHPDRNKNPGAGDDFKEINAAYQVLIDLQKRAQYDRRNPPGGNTRPSGGASGRGAGARTGAGTVRTPQNGGDLRIPLSVSFEEARFGAEKEVDVYPLEICSRCSGSMRHTVKCSHCNGAGCTRCNGVGEFLLGSCPQCNSSGRERLHRKLKITIPPGTQDGTLMRLAAAGDAGIDGGSTGDLYVTFLVRTRVESEANGPRVESEARGLRWAIAGLIVSIIGVGGVIGVLGYANSDGPAQSSQPVPSPTPGSGQALTPPTSIPTSVPTLRPTPTATSNPIPLPVLIPTPSPIPVHTPTPTRTPIPIPTPIAIPTYTPTPTPTPATPTTPTPTPTLTPTPTPTSTSTPTPGPTPIITIRVSGSDVPVSELGNALTGSGIPTGKFRITGTPILWADNKISFGFEKVGPSYSIKDVLYIGKAPQEGISIAGIKLTAVWKTAESFDDNVYDIRTRYNLIPDPILADSWVDAPESFRFTFTVPPDLGATRAPLRMIIVALAPDSDPHTFNITIPFAKSLMEFPL